MNDKLFNKLITPVHISYISQHIFKKDLKETKEIIDKLINDNIVEESQYAKEYYILKSKNK